MRSLSPVLDTLWLAGNRKDWGGGGRHSHLVFLFYSVDGSGGKGHAGGAFLLEAVFLSNKCCLSGFS